MAVCDETHPCEGLGRYATFKNFGMAFLLLFRVSTGDNWNGIMKVREFWTAFFLLLHVLVLFIIPSISIHISYYIKSYQYSLSTQVSDRDGDRTDDAVWLSEPQRHITKTLVCMRYFNLLVIILIGLTVHSAVTLLTLSNAICTYLLISLNTYTWDRLCCFSDFAAALLIDDSCFQARSTFSYIGFSLSSLHLCCCHQS